MFSRINRILDNVGKEAAFELNCIELVTVEMSLVELNWVLAIAASFNLDYSSHIMMKIGLSCPNTRTVDAKIKIKSNRDNKEGRCEERIRDRDVWGTLGQQSLLPFLGVPYFDSHRHQHQERFVGNLICHYFQICKRSASCCASWKVETQDIPKVAKLILWQGIVALEAFIQSANVKVNRWQRSVNL